MANVVETTPDTNTITVTEENRAVTVTNASTNVVEVNNLAIPSGIGGSADAVSFTPHGTVTATEVQTAIEQLADQMFKSDEAPTGANLDQGDLWYDTNDDILKVYLEVAPGTFEWRPVIVSNEDDSSILDGGLY